MRRWTPVLAFVVLLAAPSAHATFPGANGRLAMELQQQPQGIAIWSSNADGTDRKQLTVAPLADSAPVWSPDGSKIAFIRANSMAFRDLYVMDADGENEHLIDVGSTGSMQTPGWSPNGQQIAYVMGDPGDNTWDLWVANADGTGQHKVVDETVAGKLMLNPQFSPDGTKILFTMNTGGIQVVPAGGGAVETWSLGVADFSPSWSPSGQRVLFTRAAGGGETHTMTMAAGGGDRQRVGTGTKDGKARFSPDGQKIALNRGHTGPEQAMWVMDADGSNAVQIGPWAQEFDWGAADACLDGVLVGSAIAKGCFKRIEGSPGVFVTDEEAWVGGFHIKPEEGGALLLHTEQAASRGTSRLAETSAARLSVEGNGAKVFFDGQETSLPVTSIPVQAGSAEIDLSGATGSVAAALWKLPLTGKLKVTWTEGGKSAAIEAAVKVVDGLLKGSVGNVVGGDLEAELTVTLANGEGVKLESAKVTVPSLTVSLPAGAGYPLMPGAVATRVGFAGGEFTYSVIDGRALFLVRTGFTFPLAGTRQLSVSPTLVIYDGSFAGFGLQVDGLNVQLGQSGLWLQRLEGVGQWNPRFGLDLGMSATLGPDPPGNPVKMFKVTGNLRILELVKTCPGSWSELVVKGNIPILERLQLGKGEVIYAACLVSNGTTQSWTGTGTAKVELTLGQGADAIEGALGAEGRYSGWINDRGASFLVDGKIRLPNPITVVPGQPSVGDIVIAGQGVMSDIGYGFCADFGFFKAGFGAQWNQQAEPFLSCDLSRWTGPPTPATAAARRRSFEMPEGLPFAGIAAVARSGAPRVRVTGPGGVRIDTAGKLVRRKNVVVYPMPLVNRTYVFVRKPRAGRWSVTALKGDKVSRIEFARGLDKPKVKARVRRRGKRYRLTYTVRRQPGQVVQFIERTASGGVHPIGKPTRRRTGTIKFKPVSDPKRRRTIEANVVQHKLPRATIRVTRFRTAP